MVFYNDIDNEVQLFADGFVNGLIPDLENQYLFGSTQNQQTNPNYITAEVAGEETADVLVSDTVLMHVIYQSCQTIIVSYYNFYVVESTLNITNKLHFSPDTGTVKLPQDSK